MLWENILKAHVKSTDADWASHSHAQFMVNSEVWLEAGFEKTYLKSVTELEKALERELIADDFTDAPLNWDWEDNYSWVLNPKEAQILKNRMGSEGRKKIAQEYLDSFWEYYPMAKAIPELMLLYEAAKKIAGD